MHIRRRMKWLPLLTLSLLLTGCPDNGQFLNLCDNPDLDCDDGNACTVDSCDPRFGCMSETISCDDSNECTADSCDSATGCLNVERPCGDNNECTTDSCDPASGCVNEDNSARCDDSSVCTTDSCDPASGCVNDTISCDDDNECTAESCDAVMGCDSTPVADGTSCNRGLGMCAAGVCEAVSCTSDAACDDSDACTQDSCNMATNECVNVDISDSCDDDNLCTADSCDSATGCVNADNSAACDDGEECTAESCDAQTGCSSEPVADGTPCDGGAGDCSGGVCISSSIVEYTQDFESFDVMDIDALANDSWVVFGAVFDGTSGDFLYQYGTFTAPNDGAAFSALASGQGGDEQGNVQLSIYSDYNNTDHSIGHTIEASFFRERTIGPADVGRTITFAFDAKAGNINDPGDPLCPCQSTAFAFIKTIDPANNFNQTNLIQEITTNLPDTWGRFEISLPVDAGLDGQLLQIGFTTTATLFQPSANFYDNLEVRSGRTPGS